MNQFDSCLPRRTAVGILALLLFAPAADAADLKFTSDYAPYEDGSEAIVSIENVGPAEIGGLPAPGCDVSISVVDQAGATLSTQVVTARPRIANMAPATLPAAPSGIGYVRFEATYAKSSSCSPKVVRMSAVVLPVPAPTNPNRRLTTMTRLRVASLMK